VANALRMNNTLTSLDLSTMLSPRRRPKREDAMGVLLAFDANETLTSLKLSRDLKIQWFADQATNRNKQKQLA
jgi:hypothetical protein